MILKQEQQPQENQTKLNQTCFHVLEKTSKNKKGMRHVRLVSLLLWLERSQYDAHTVCIH